MTNIFLKATGIKSLYGKSPLLELEVIQSKWERVKQFTFRAVSESIRRFLNGYFSETLRKSDRDTEDQVSFLKLQDYACLLKQKWTSGAPLVFPSCAILLDLEVKLAHNVQWNEQRKRKKPNLQTISSFLKASGITHIYRECTGLKKTSLETLYIATLYSWKCSLNDLLRLRNLSANKQFADAEGWGGNERNSWIVS